MTVADMTPLQLYGLIMCAFLVIGMANLGLRELKAEDPDMSIIKKGMMYLGFGILVIGPAIAGVLSLQQ